MRHSLPKTPQFYVTAPQECPYLDNRVERKLFTALSGPGSEVLNDALSKQGFRRSQNVLYRPSCADCSECLSARIPTENYEFSKSEKKIFRRNKILKRSIKSPIATEEHFELFKSYVLCRHEKGGMAGMDEYEFTSMIEETSVETFLCEYSVMSEDESRLVAVSLTDRINDGLSMVYSFYDPSMNKLSLGKYMIIDHVNLAREQKLAYLYLGYWVKGSKKMNYKSQYSPLEVFSNGAWSNIHNGATKGSSEPTESNFTEKNNTIFLPDSPKNE